MDKLAGSIHKLASTEWQHDAFAEKSQRVSHEEAVDTDQQNHLPRRTSGTPSEVTFALDHSRVYKLCLQNKYSKNVYIP